MPHPLVGKEAPALSLPETNGETYTFEPTKIGQPVALFFFPKAGECLAFPPTFREESHCYRGRYIWLYQGGVPV